MTAHADTTKRPHPGHKNTDRAIAARKRAAAERLEQKALRIRGEADQLEQRYRRTVEEAGAA